FFSSRRRHTRWPRDWSSGVCSSDLSCRSLVSGSCDLQDVRTVAGGVARAAHLALPLSSVPAGAYTARARVMSGSDTVAEVLREVDIRAGGRPAAEIDDDSSAFDPREVVNGALARQVAVRLVDA